MRVVSAAPEARLDSSYSQVGVREPHYLWHVAGDGEKKSRFTWGVGVLF